MAVDEREAVARLRRGDIGGLEVLVRRYQVRAVRASYLISGDAALAEDVVQGAFLRVYERIGQFDQGRAFAPWFLRIVANETLMALRRQPLSLDTVFGDDETALDRALGASLDRGVEQVLEDAETRAELGVALARLSAEQRAVVVLRYYLDLSDREIAERLQLAPGTVRWRLHSAREKLRNLLPSRIMRPAIGASDE